jgi:hypothetical protein
MAYHQQQDPLLSTIDEELNKCDYGNLRDSVRTQIHNFMTQYPIFSLETKHFKYGGTKSNSKMIYLNGAIRITHEDTNKQEQIPVHFILPSGFPSVAPKCFLSKPPDKKLIKENPFIREGNEIYNQYLDKWQGFNATYNLNMLFYYIY